MQLNHAALVGFDLNEMEGDVAVELLEKWNPITNQDWQERITNVVRKPEAKAFGADYAASNKPDVVERGKPDAYDLCKRFRRVCKKAGITDLRIHDLRHFATTMLFMEGLPDTIIRKNDRPYIGRQGATSTWTAVCKSECGKNQR